jgi:hypothetical protein
MSWVYILPNQQRRRRITNEAGAEQGRISRVEKMRRCEMEMRR